ncbi:Methyltransferase domain-containing protein [Fodinibius salinus]|uniref:Methyltransferase domain-containing protein n=1 Tax=Fodinibius salinus TaxID=860790 RepID=A0A5D3YF75_9BACT|nr:class I SAM-dependent methyltransferase [Fodinibius salinus]TYP91686.1 Methyltransferase domain-containing protein [Fodinibius salinus]
MDWFEEWFDSPLYEKLYANRDVQEAAQLVALLENSLPLEECSSILDLGCGRGRHAITLNQKGYSVTGIDLSKQAIATARQKAKELELSDIRFEVRDMRNPLPEKFDAIVNLFTTFGYFESDDENAVVLESVQQMLDPGGIFVLDYMNAQHVRHHFQPVDSGEFQGIHYDIERYIEDNSIFKEITFSGDKVEGTKKYAERVKLYDLSWFEEQLTDHGLHIDHVYGDYKGNDFDPESSDRLLIVSHLE